MASWITPAIAAWHNQPRPIQWMAPGEAPPTDKAPKGAFVVIDQCGLSQPDSCWSGCALYPFTGADADLATEGACKSRWAFIANLIGN
ncbi:hypothetical protein SAMN05216255_3146 [Pseudomonas segetis]|uniref:Uncharacterized protein n=1 Tax=Pseudomonas segetis TaxID=298908 RepID=A0A239GTP4_9PSED|nr:hypothetical protein SAMN05216255_3146 [Pseudomonas segetis]